MVTSVRAGIGDARKGRAKLEQDKAPALGRWAEACFPDVYSTTEAELRELLDKAAEAARDDYGVASALEWADGFGERCALFAGGAAGFQDYGRPTAQAVSPRPPERRASG